MKTKFDALILGAGMVGATAALMLARKGFSVALIERQALQLMEDKFSATSLPAEVDQRVSAISPASQQLLHELGVWKQASRLRSCDYHKMTVWHENGSAQMQFACEQVGRSHLGTIIENELLQSVLIHQLSQLPNVQLFDQQQVTAIEQNDTAVQLTTSAGITLPGELLIAADGRASSARKLLHLPVTRGSYQQTAIVANVSTEKSHQNTAWQRFLSTGPLAFLPLSNGQSSIVWSADCGRAEELLSLSDDEFCLQLAQAFENRLGKIIKIGPRAGFPLGWHTAERWLQGRVLLIGDAAHGVHPLAGQGVNLGFADVALLSHKISVGQAIFQTRLLRQFERQRKAEAVTATHLFSALKLIYGQPSPLFSKFRDLGMMAVEQNILLKRLVLNSAMQNMA